MRNVRLQNTWTVCHTPGVHNRILNVGRIAPPWASEGFFPWGVSRGISQKFFQGGQKWENWVFTPRNWKNNFFLLILSKSRGSKPTPLPPSDAHVRHNRLSWWITADSEFKFFLNCFCYASTHRLACFHTSVWPCFY